MKLISIQINEKNPDDNKSFKEKMTILAKNSSFVTSSQESSGFEEDFYYWSFNLFTLSLAKLWGELNVSIQTNFVNDEGFLMIVAQLTDDWDDYVILYDSLKPGQYDIWDNLLL